MKANQDLKRSLERIALGKSGYPAATVSYFGPDDRFASKVVVGISFGAPHGDIDRVRTWHSTGDDVRRDLGIHAEIFSFLQANEAEKVVVVDRIIGCPHEDGIDYPHGGTCPHCPFWSGRDR
jgi:hypothetical protein